MRKYTMPRSAYIPEGAEKITRDGVNAEVYVYETTKGQPAAAMFGGKRSKPDKQFYYRSPERRDEAVEQYFDSIAESDANKAARRANRRMSSQALVAKEIRHYLKAKGITCKARSDSFSMGDSVDVTVYDQPPAVMKEINDFCSKYQYGHFDGMTDMYEYSNRRQDIPQTKYLHVNNSYSPALEQKAWEYIQAHYAGTDEYPAVYKDVPSHARVFDEWHSTAVYRLLNGSDGDNSIEFWASNTPEPVKPVTVDAITLSEGTKPGFSEIRFPSKPDESVRSALKAAGYRWSRTNGCWYGKTDKLPSIIQA